MGAFRNDDERLPVVTTDSHTDQGTPGFPWTIRQSEKSERNSRRKLQSEDPSTGHKWLYSLALSFFLPSSQLQRDAAAEPAQKPTQQRIPKQTRKQKQKQMQQEIQKPSEEQTGYWALFRLALPSILLQSGAPLAITVQTALLGRKDTQLVAAWAVVATATNAATVIFNFLVVGVTAKVTKVVAVGGWTQVGARIRLALAMALATGAVAVALLLSAQGLLWTMLSHSPSVLQYAKSYFYLRVMGVPPQLLVMCTSGVLQGYKHVVLVAWLQAARVLLDVLASYISLYVLDWGLVGVGIGTILASCTVAAASFACILLLPPPEGKGKICIFSPILSFLARRVAGPQRLLCRASSQLISRTCSKARMCGVAVLEDARVLLLDGLERDRDGKEGGGIEGRTVKSCESAYELIQQSHGCAHGEGATEYEAREGWDEEKEGREGQQVEGRESEVDGAEESRPVAKKPEKEADEESERNTYNEEMLLGVDGGVRRVGPAWPCVVELEVRVVVEGEEESTNLLSKAGKGERMGKGEEVEKSESPGDEKGESVASEEILRGEEGAAARGERERKGRARQRRRRRRRG
ncbi:hypothetical protein CLOM_g3798 [Closterium sp. NIES-68]|nr:hypothetical protein CLOM_g3798 [Closterium sp. NIES-68]